MRSQPPTIHPQQLVRLIAAAALLAAGCSDTSTQKPTAACDGSGHAIPSGFPALGASACAAHVTYRVRPDASSGFAARDEVGGQGFRTVSGSALKAFVVRDPGGGPEPVYFKSLALALVSLDKGSYKTTNDGCTQLDAQTPDHRFEARAGDLTVEIAGNDGSAAWGTFAGKVCRLVDSKYVAGQIVNTYACHVVLDGRFAALIEAGNSDAPIVPPPGGCKGGPLPDSGPVTDQGGPPPPPPDQGGPPPPPPDQGGPPPPPPDQGGPPPPPPIDAGGPPPPPPLDAGGPPPPPPIDAGVPPPP